MPLVYDATLKDLAAGYPRDFLALFDPPATQPLRPLNVDLSTVTTAADLVVGLGEPLAEVVHIDFQSSADAGKGADVLVYNALLFRQYCVPVHSILVLLRPQAAHSDVNGTVAYASRPDRGRMNFGYEVVPLWERPGEGLLSGALGTAPLAMLGALPEGVELVAGLTGVAQRLIHRLEQEATPGQTKLLLMAAYLLTGLRVKRSVGNQVFAGVRPMRDSDTYLAIIDEGREVQLKEDIHLLAKHKFQTEEPWVLTRLEGITDLERLKRILLRTPQATSWQDLLDTP